MSELARAIPWGKDESVFVSELQSGSEAAFDWLVTHYHASVYSLVFRMVGNSADAADVTQDVFLKVYRGIRGFQQGSSLKTWLYRIAIREALNQRRWWTRHWRRLTSMEPDPGDENPAPAVDGESKEPSPFDRTAAGEVQRAVHQALARMPEVFRAAVVLRDLEGLSYEEVAEVLEISVGTVKSRIVRGRRALRLLLEPLLRAEAHEDSTQASRCTAVAARRSPTRVTRATAGGVP